MWVELLSLVSNFLCSKFKLYTIISNKIEVVTVDFIAVGFMSHSCFKRSFIHCLCLGFSFFSLFILLGCHVLYQDGNHNSTSFVLWFNLDFTSSGKKTKFIWEYAQVICLVKRKWDERRWIQRFFFFATRGRVWVQRLSGECKD